MFKLLNWKKVYNIRNNYWLTDILAWVSILASSDIGFFLFLSKNMAAIIAAASKIAHGITIPRIAPVDKPPLLDFLA